MAQLRLIAVAIAGASVAGVAHADPGDAIRAPAGWMTAPDDDAQVHARTVPHLGGTSAAIEIDGYTPPGGVRGVALVVSQVIAPLPSDPAAAIRAEVELFHGAVRRAALAGGSADETAWQTRVDPDAKLVTADLAFVDRASLASTSRLVIATSQQRAVAVSAECIAATDAPRALRDACIAALATLAPPIDVHDRTAPALAPEGTPAPDVPLPPSLPGSPGPSMSAPSMSAPPHTPLPPIEVAPPPPEAADRRPFFVGAGIVLLAAAFWWNRRHRARLEAHEEDPDDR